MYKLNLNATIKITVIRVNTVSVAIKPFEIDALDGLSNLKKVCLYENPITDFSPEILESIRDISLCKVFVSSAC